MLYGFASTPALAWFWRFKATLDENLWFGYTLLFMCSYLCCMPRDSPFSWRRCPESENWCCLTCRNSESPIQRSEVFTSLYWFLKVRDTAPPSPALVGGASPWIRHGWGTPQLSLQGQSRGLCFRSRKCSRQDELLVRQVCHHDIMVMDGYGIIFWR